MDNSFKGPAERDIIEFFCYQLSQLDLGIEKLAEQYPNKTSFLAHHLHEFKDDIDRVVRPRIAPMNQTTSSLTLDGPNEQSTDAPPSAILHDEQLNDYLHSEMISEFNVNYFLSPGAAPVSSTEAPVEYFNDTSGIADVGTDSHHGVGQDNELSSLSDDGDTQPITTSQELQTYLQVTAPTYANSEAQIGDDNLCNEASSLNHSLENSRAVQGPRGSRKRTANEIVGTSSTSTRSNKQRGRSDWTKTSENANHQLSKASDKVTRDLNTFLDEKKVDNLASRSTLLKCVGYFRDFSPLHHLNETLQSIRKGMSLQLLPTSTDIAGTNTKLEQLDRLSSTCSVLRRIYLVRLLEHRDNLEARLKDQCPNANLRKSKGSNKVATQVLERMLEDMYPTKAFGNFKDRNHPQNGHLKKRLHNNLAAARKWSFIRDKFSFGMLFLIPAGAGYGINNQDVECLSKDTIQHLFDFIFAQSGDTLRRFAEAIAPQLHEIVDGKITQRKFKFELLGTDDLSYVSRDQGKLLDICVLDDEVSSG